MLVALPFGLGVVSVASSVLSTSPSADRHGDALIFGTMCAILFGSVFFAVLPLTAPRATSDVVTRVPRGVRADGGPDNQPINGTNATGQGTAARTGDV